MAASGLGVGVDIAGARLMLPHAEGAGRVGTLRWGGRVAAARQRR